MLPPDAGSLDRLCRQLVDQFTRWGYELVVPPLVEYLDTLLVGADKDLELQTFKIIDQLNGKLMGVRADTTPQVARINARTLKRKGPSRLCYMGAVLHTLPGEPGGTRSPLQTGAELYGHAGPESDAEILALMLKTLQLTGLENVHVDIGHTGILRGLIEPMQLAPERRASLLDCVRRKASDELRAGLGDWGLAGRQSEALLELLDMEGDVSMLDECKRVLAPCGEALCAYVDELRKLAALTMGRVRNAPLFFDVTGFQGYRYHTGVTFVAYAPGESQGVAHGGRYDEIGRALGRPGPATGFSADAGKLFRLAPRTAEPTLAIYAPNSMMPGFYDVVDKLRAQGETVISELPGQPGDPRDLGCDRELRMEQGQWQVRPLN